MDKQNGSKLHIPPTISWLLNRSHTKKYSQVFWKKVRRMAHEQKDDHVSCTPVIDVLYHPVGGFISSKLT